MLFVLCHPSLPPEAQIGLSLRILCGFGIEEIANAFLSNKETISKRLQRAKETLRREKVKIELPVDAEIDKRLGNVLKTLYLLFNEGYYSESGDTELRKDLCLEAMRLTYLLLENKSTDVPAVNSLLALMCFHASRFDARTNSKGETVLYDEQDELLWNQELIRRGAYYFHRSAGGPDISSYHLEAGIAYWQTQKDDTYEKWDNILQHYNRLLQLAYSPVAALNRTFALAKVNTHLHGKQGKQMTITEAEKLNLNNNHFYFMLLGELYSDSDDQKSQSHFRKALGLAKTESDKKTIQKKLK